MFDSSLEVQIKGDKDEFVADLVEFKRVIDAGDRTWLPDRGVWLVKNPAKYAYLNFVQLCMDTRKMQLSLF